ncbi:MAG TPA: DUF1428 domain-containing protein [Planctomycetota bacterium]|nr:DUF1428 domain-containing protein [Planctomycetota bacterium]
MARYIDAIVVPVPKKNLAAYRSAARKSAKIWIEHGATSYVECAADDVKAGKVTSFPQSVKLKAGETVVTGWIEYPSRKARDRTMAKVMGDPRVAKLFEKMPFDGARMFWGGFKPIVEARAGGS